MLYQTLVISVMLGVGFWALARGWQLTLVSFAIAPVFAGVTALQSNIVSKCEGRNMRAREDSEVAKPYYDVSQCIIPPFNTMRCSLCFALDDLACLHHPCDGLRGRVTGEVRHCRRLHAAYAVHSLRAAHTVLGAL